MKPTPLSESVIKCPEVQVYLETADKNYAAVGYKEHGVRHAQLTSNIAGNVLRFLDYSPEEIELATVAGYLHDIGNSIAREDHAQTGGVLSLDILEKLNVPYDKIFLVINAVGSHEDRDADVTSPITAAVILGDKTDVHHTRVRTKDIATLDMHGRANYACQRSFLRVNKENRIISLELTIDTKICSVMEYFEIFLARTNFCRKASKALSCDLELYINKDKFL
jgi:metal-dependent HD superfamily phosphatase/phosphodiesterase